MLANNQSFIHSVSLSSFSAGGRLCSFVCCLFFFESESAASSRLEVEGRLSFSAYILAFRYIQLVIELSTANRVRFLIKLSLKKVPEIKRNIDFMHFY
jgi:hypothetical protein